MYQGNYSSKKRKTKNRKPLVLLASVAVLVCTMVGGTLAWLTTTTSQVTNTFTPAHVTCAVDESFSAARKSDVSIKNTGDIDAYIRAKIVVSWQDKDGNLYSQTPVLGTDYELNLSNAWTRGTDGFYYYKDAVAPSQNTNPLILSAKVLARPQGMPAEFDNFNLAIEIIAEAIQAAGTTGGANPVPAVKDAWPAWPY